MDSRFRDLYTLFLTVFFNLKSAQCTSSWDVVQMGCKNHLPCPPTPSFVSPTDKLEECDKNEKTDLISSSLISPATLLLSSCATQKFTILLIGIVNFNNFV